MASTDSAFANQFSGGSGAGWGLAETGGTGVTLSAALGTTKYIRAGQTISSISRTSNVVSVVLTGNYPNNNLKVGQKIVITGVSGFTGSFTIATVANQSNFTYSQVASDATGSVSGSSIAGGDYTSLITWEATIPASLVTPAKIFIAECYNDWPGGLDNVTNFIINTHTTDAGHYIKIMAPASERGVAGAGFRILPSSGNPNSITITGANITLEGFEATGPVVVQTGTTTTDSSCLYTGGLTVSSGATLSLGGVDFTNLGAVTLSSGSTIVYTGPMLTDNGVAVTLLNTAHHHLTLAPPTNTTFGLPADCVVNGNLSINFPANLVANDFNMTVKGNWTNPGSFTPGVGSVTLNGTLQTIDGSTTFYNLTKDVSAAAADTLTFTAGTTQTIALGGTLTLKGASGKVLTLSGSAAWYLNVNGSSSVDFVNVTYSDASGGKTIVPISSNSIDSLNNVNWLFDSANTNKWTGATSTSWGTSPGSASLNWSKGKVPVAADKVVIDVSSGNQPTISVPVTIASINLTGSSMLTVSIPIPTFGDITGITTTGDVQMYGTSKITHLDHPFVSGVTTIEKYHLKMLVGGNLTIASTAAINVDEKGFPRFGGPGSPPSRSSGSYGGLGSIDGNTYGSITAPSNIGSGGYDTDMAARAGGAAIITVSGASVISGTISANSFPIIGTNGSGGSVYLTTGTISGSGAISANCYINSHAGGGGRVAIILTNPTADFSNFVGAVSAYGSDNGASGTIYEETGAQYALGPGHGDLIIKELYTTVLAVIGVDTRISSLVTDATVGTVKLTTVTSASPRKIAKLTIDPGATLTLLGAVTGNTINIESGTDSLGRVNTLTNNGAFTIGGTTFVAGSGTYTAGLGSTTTYTGQADNSPVTLLSSAAYYNIVLNKTGTTFKLPADITVSKNWTNIGGNFDPAPYTVTLNGTMQTIAGTTTFYKLTKDISAAGAADTLTFAAGLTQTIFSSGTLTLKGAPGKLLSLRSSVNNTQWSISPPDTRNVSYCDVKDSNNNNAIEITANNSVSSGNNTNWLFMGASLSATDVQPATLVAGIKGNATVSFTTVSTIPLGGKIKITFPSNFDISSAGFSSATGINGSFSPSVVGQAVTLTRSGGTNSPVGAKTITLTNIKNPNDTGSTGLYAIETETSGGLAIDSNNAVSADTIISGGALTATDVIPFGSPKPLANAVGNVTVNFTTVNPVPADGKIVVTFPSGFTFDSGGATAVSGPPTGLDGSFAVSTSGQVVTITRLGGTQSAVGAKAIILTNIQNPPLKGSTGTYAIQTNTASNNLTTGKIDADPAVTADTIYSADLTSWDLNMSAGTLTMTFNSPVDSATLDATGITIQDMQSASPTNSYTLTGGTTTSPPGPTIVVNLTATDMNGIKAIAGLAKSQSNSYISITSATISDISTPQVNAVNAITRANALQVTNYTADSTPPSLLNWSLDMNAHTMTLNFNESMKASSWTPVSVTLQNTAASPTKTYTLTAGSTTASPNGTSLVVTLSTADFNNIFDFSGGGLCDALGNSYLTFLLGAIKDMANNNIAAVTTGMNASAFTANAKAATNFKLTTSSGAVSTSVTAGTPMVGVTLKTYDGPAGYRTKLYSGNKTIVFSGANDSPDPATTPTASNNATADINFGLNTTMTFTNGIGSGTLTLYRKENALITANETSIITTATADALTVTVNPDMKAKLFFSQQPSSSATINSALTQQPIVVIRDVYGNQTADVDPVQISDSSNNVFFSDAPGALSSDQPSNTIAAVNGLATFTGVKYDAPGTVYIDAESGSLQGAFSNAISFSTAGTTSVDAAASPVVNFNLTPTNDSDPEKFAALKFKITDHGGDSTPTLIDRIRVSVGGTGANASGDIAWAGLYQGALQVATATGAAITNTDITFGATPNSDSIAALDTVPDNAVNDYTVYIYMKNSKLAATASNTYTFSMNETLVGNDGGTSTRMANNTSAVSTVIGTIKVDISSFEIVSQSTGASSANLTAGQPYELRIRATDSNKNVDINYTNNKSLLFSGLSQVGVNKPKIESTPFGTSIIVKFVAGVSDFNPVTLANAVTLTPYKAESGNVSVAEGGLGYSVFPFGVNVSADAPSTLTLTSGDNQVGKTSKQLPTPLLVTATDQWGNTASNQGVAFTVSGSGSPSVTPTNPQTDSIGQASTLLTLGSLDGSATTVTATASFGTPVTFTETGRTPRSIFIVSGDNQTKVIGLALDNPLICKLVDVTSGDGNPIPNETITFAFPTGGFPTGATGQTISPSSALTPANGQVTTNLTLGSITGNYLVRATYLSINKDFTATGSSEGATQITLTGPASVTAGQPSAVFTITTRDKFNNEIPLTQNTTFTLSTTQSSTGAFYSDSGATALITQLTITSGSSQGKFYYKDSLAGNLTLTASRASGQALPDGATSSTAITVIPANISYFKVTATDMSTMTAAVSRNMIVTAYDVFNNPSTNAGTINVTFDAALAHLSPSGQAPTVNNIAFGTPTSLTFGSSTGQAPATLILYKPEAAMIKASAGSAVTSDPNALQLTVMHAPADHIKFEANLPTPQSAGTSFNLGTKIDVVDRYDNVCDSVNGAAPFSASQQPVSWTLSGIANSPDGFTQDVMPSASIDFTDGRSTSPLSANLYRAQKTRVIAHIASLLNGVADQQSSEITVNAGPINKLSFFPQPSSTCITGQLLTVQPKVAVADQFGNPSVSATGSILLTPVTDTIGSGTPATNGTLGGTTTQTISNGVAEFTNLTYDYPEQIYLKATVAGVPLSPVFSVPITFSATTDLSATALLAAEKTANNITGTVSSVANTTAGKVSVYGFKVTDAGSDGLDGLVTQIVIHRSLSDTVGNWTTFITGAYMTEGATTLLGTVSANTITFGDKSSTLFPVPNNTTKTYILSLVMKKPLPTSADGKILGFTLTPNADISVNAALGSSFTPAVPPISDTGVVAVVATDLKLSGANSMTSGGSNTITITAIDANGNIDKDYNTPPQGLIFSGAGVSPSLQSPTCSDSGGSDINFGDSTQVTFASGSSSPIVMKLYKAEVATISVTAATLSSSASSRLLVTVGGGPASRLIWKTQPVSKVAASAPWKPFVISVADAYGNTSSSTTTVTVGLVDAASGIIPAGAVNTVDAVAGSATFNNFFVTCPAYPGSVALNATAPLVTDSGPSTAVIVEQQYQITLNIKDTVTATQLTETTLTVVTKNGQTVYGPITGNSPFNFVLSYGTYTFLTTKDKYLDFSTEQTVGVAADGVDGNYDNNITWTNYMTSLTEATADYIVRSSFVYDEDSQGLTMRLWLERRGKLILNNSINLLGPATVDVYDDSTGSWLNTIAVTPPLASDITNGTYVSVVNNVLSVGNAFGTSLVSGKTYFAKCRVQYGGLDGTANLYESGTTFTVTITQKLSKEIIDKLGVSSGQTLGNMINTVQAAVTGVSNKVDTVGNKVDTVGNKVDTVGNKVDTVSTKVDAVGTSVDLVGTKVNTVNSTVTAILEDTSLTLPEQMTSTVTSEAEKGVQAQILTRNTVIRTDDTIAIRYRTATGLSPTLTVYDADGKTMNDYNTVKMKEIGTIGIYEYSVTSNENWVSGDYTVVCKETTKGSKDSMVLTVKALFVAGQGVESAVDQIGESMTKVYTRTGTIQNLLGSKTDKRTNSTVLGMVNGLSSTVDGLNLSSVATDASNARSSALKAAEDIASIKDQFADINTRMNSLREFTSQIEELKNSLRKIAQGTAAAGNAGQTGIALISTGGGSASEVAAQAKASSATSGNVLTTDPARQRDLKEVNNKIEELTALTKVLTKLVDNTNNKPVVEGWFETQ